MAGQAAHRQGRQQAPADQLGVDPNADGGDGADAFTAKGHLGGFVEAQLAAVGPQQAQGVEHIAKVEADRLNRQLNLAGAGAACRGGERDGLEALEQANAAGRKAKTLGRQRPQPLAVQLAPIPAQGQLGRRQGLNLGPGQAGDQRGRGGAGVSRRQQVQAQPPVLGLLERRRLGQPLEGPADGGVVGSVEQQPHRGSGLLGALQQGCCGGQGIGPQSAGAQQPWRGLHRGQLAGGNGFPFGAHQPIGRARRGGGLEGRGIGVLQRKQPVEGRPGQPAQTEPADPAQRLVAGRRQQQQIGQHKGRFVAGAQLHLTAQLIGQRQLLQADGLKPHRQQQLPSSCLGVKRGRYRLKAAIEQGPILGIMLTLQRRPGPIALAMQGHQAAECGAIAEAERLECAIETVQLERLGTGRQGRGCWGLRLGLRLRLGLGGGRVLGLGLGKCFLGRLRSRHAGINVL